MDIHVADNIFEKAIKKLLIGKGKTVIMATSHLKYLSEGNNIYYFKNG